MFYWRKFESHLWDVNIGHNLTLFINTCIFFKNLCQLYKTGEERKNTHSSIHPFNNYSWKVLTMSQVYLWDKSESIHLFFLKPALLRFCNSYTRNAPILCVQFDAFWQSQSRYGTFFPLPPESFFWLFCCQFSPPFQPPNPSQTNAVILLVPF